MDSDSFSFPRKIGDFFYICIFNHHERTKIETTVSSEVKRTFIYFFFIAWKMWNGFSFQFRRARCFYNCIFPVRKSKDWSGSSFQVRGLADLEPTNSRPSSPVGDQGGQCASSSPSPSTGPPTKCATPISEPHSPNPPPLVNPKLPPLGGTSTHSRLPSHPSAPDPPPPRHPSVEASALAAAVAVATRPPGPQHPHMPPEYHPYPMLPHRPPYDLSSAPSSSLLAVSEADVNRSEEHNKCQSALPRSPYQSQLVRISCQYLLIFRFRLLIE